MAGGVDCMFSLVPHLLIDHCNLVIQRIAAMAFSWVPSVSGSPDLGRLVQDRLRKVHQQFPASCPRTLGDFRVVADKLSAIAEASQAVTKRLETQDGTYNAAEAFKELERALDWAECTADGSS